jgi:hypothetical protein
MQESLSSKLAIFSSQDKNLLPFIVMTEAKVRKEFAEDNVLELRNRVTISVAHWSVTIVFSSARTDMITSQQMNISFVIAQMPTLVSQVFWTR